MTLSTPPRTPFPDILGNRVYSFDYFSGSQIKLVVGEVTLDEVFALEYSLQQNKVPVYGYASQYFNAVASGTVLVTGRMMMNYTDVFALPSVLKRFISSNASQTAGAEEEAADDILRETAQAGSQSEAEIARRISSLTDDELDLVRRRVIQRSALEATAEEGPFSRNIPHGTTLSASEFLNHRRGDQYPGFDIVIHAGDRSSERSNYTVRTIINAHIIGDGQQIMLDGQPVAVEYNFIAKTVR